MQAASGDRDAVAEQAWLAQVIEALGERPAGAHRAAARGRPERDCATSQPLTAKPVLFVANVDEGDEEFPAAIAAHAADAGSRSGRPVLGLEAELGRAGRGGRRRDARERSRLGESGLEPGSCEVPSACST